MLKKFFKPISTGGASALIAFTSLLSYVAGLIRDRTIAVHFGTTTATDTYNASFLIPDSLFNLFIAGALTASFMPIFASYVNKDKEEAKVLANTVLTGASILTAILIVLAFIFTKQIIPVLFPEVSIEGQQDIIKMTRLMLPSAFLFSISNTLGNILMTYRHFMSFSLSPVLYNLGIITGILFFNEEYGIYSAAIGVLIGGVLHASVRIIDTLYTEYKYRPQLKLKHPGFKKTVRLMIPKAISLIAWQINLYIFATVGMKLAEGGYAAFNFARNIQGFAVTLFGVALATAVFPSLNAAYSNGDKQTYTSDTQVTTQRILFFTIPVAVGMTLMAKPFTELVLGGGMFDANSVAITSILLIFFAVSIPFESLTQLYTRSFYATQNTLTPTLINIFAFLIMGLTTIYIAPKYGINWFSIGYSIGYLFYCIMLISALNKRVSGFKWKDFSKSLLKIITASIIMGAFIFFTRDFYIQLQIPAKIYTCLEIIIAASIYFVITGLFKSSEISSVKVIFKRIWPKRV